MRRFSFFCFVALSSPLLVSVCPAQAVPAAVAVDTGAHGGGPLVSPVQGFNLSVDFTTEHTSSTGWSNVLTPEVSYRFDRRFSLTAEVPYYLSVRNYVPEKKDPSVDHLETGTSLLGDTVFGGNFESAFGNFDNEVVGSLGIPTGDDRFGLSAKQATYNVSDHLDYQVGIFDPEIDVGEGDSSALTGLPVRKTYTAVGPLANFEAGTAVDLPFALSIDADLYEDLPLGTQTVYGTVTRKRKDGSSGTTKVLAGTGNAEDNGVIAEVDVPVGGHFLVAGAYERSFLQALDTFSVGVTYTLRKPKISRN